MNAREITRALALILLVGSMACAPEASSDATTETEPEPETTSDTAAMPEADPEPATDLDTFSITVDVSEFRNSDGMAQITLYDKEEDFLSDDSETARVERVEIDGKKATVTFEGVAPGQYAVALMHDEDGDGEMKTNLIGIPKEGIGMSNDARPKFGPPKWKDAVFTVDNKDVALTISMMYM